MPTLPLESDGENDHIETLSPAWDATRPQATQLDSEMSLEPPKRPYGVSDSDTDLEGGGSGTTRKRSASSASAVGEWVGFLSGRIRGWTRSASGGATPASGQGSPTLPPEVRLGSVGPWDERFDSLLLRIRARRPRLGKSLIWLRGPSPPWIETEFPPFPIPYVGSWLHRFELWCTLKLAFMQRWREFITPVFLLAWLLGFIFLVRASFFTVEDTPNGAPAWIGATASYWEADTGCGINGSACANSPGSTFVFRCPSQSLGVRLLNPYAIGAESVIYEPLVVGGFDAQQTYRADSWLCAAAIQQGIFAAHQGGCGQLELIGEFTDFVGGHQNGVQSRSFDTSFPSAYRFIGDTPQKGCRDLRDDVLGFDVAMSVVFSFFIRPSPRTFFWVLLIVGSWHNALASDPVSMPRE